MHAYDLGLNPLIHFGLKYVVAVLEQFSFSLGSYTCKRIFLVHIITNNQQMANKLLHVLFPYKVSKITQH